MSQTKISKNRIALLEKISLESDDLIVSFLPERGGKMVELRNKKTNTQFLLEPLNPDKSYDAPEYGAKFTAFDANGFDECFPSVEPASYQNPYDEEKGPIEIPDHGELWSLPWDFELKDDSLVLRASGIRLNYTLQKTIKVKGNRVQIDYELTNNSSVPFHYVWSAHPLLNVQEGDQLLLPDEIKQLFVNWSSKSEIGQYGDFTTWPFLGTENNHKTDYSVVQSPSLGEAVKLFSNTLTTDYAGVYFNHRNESLLFHYDPEEIPFLGIWLCYGGWPENNGNGNRQLTIALEPTNGRPDSISRSLSRNECRYIDANSQTSWSLAISLWQGKPGL